MFKKKIRAAKCTCYSTFSAVGPGLFSGKLFATYRSSPVTFYLHLCLLQIFSVTNT